MATLKRPSEVSAADWAKMSDADKRDAITYYKRFPGGASTLGGEIKADIGAVAKPFEEGPRALLNQFLTGGTMDVLGAKKADPKKRKPGKGGGGSNMNETKALQELAKILSSNLADNAMLQFGSLGQTLANENQAVTQGLGQYMTGGGAGAYPGSGAVSAAMEAYNKAYAAGEGGQSAAYAQGGIANANYIASSPYYPLLSLFSNVTNPQYTSLPASLVNALDPQTRQLLANRGFSEVPTGTAALTGTVPISGTGGANNTANILAQIARQTQTPPPGTPPPSGNPSNPGG